jgi:DNA-binding LytR/AlgR family response regulator
LIIEDEILAQQVMQNHIAKLDALTLINTCSNAIEAMEILQQQEVDLIFLDIQMPGMTGLHMLRMLPDPPLVILTTAYAEYALESYELNVIDYLLKPISFERFAKAVNKIADGRLFSQVSKISDAQQTDHIFIRSNSKYFRVAFNEIVYIESMRDYLKIHTTSFTLITHQTMQEMEQLLPSKQFIRIHKSYIIAKAFVKCVTNNAVELSKINLPIGLTYRENVLSALGIK